MARKRSPNILSTLVRNFLAKNFQKSPNLVTLVSIPCAKKVDRKEDFEENKNNENSCKLQLQQVNVHRYGMVDSFGDRQTACWRPACCWLRRGSMSIGDPSKSHQGGSGGLGLKKNRRAVTWDVQKKERKRRNICFHLRNELLRLEQRQLREQVAAPPDHWVCRRVGHHDHADRRALLGRLLLRHLPKRTSLRFKRWRLLSPEWARSRGRRPRWGQTMRRIKRHIIINKLFLKQITLATFIRNGDCGPNHKQTQDVEIAEYPQLGHLFSPDARCCSFLLVWTSGAK